MPAAFAALGSRDVVVTAPESEKQRVACGRLQLIETRTLGFRFIAAVGREIWNFLHFAPPRARDTSVTKSLKPIRPHAKLCVWASREVALQLLHALFFVRWPHVLLFAFHDEPGVFL